MGIFFVRVFRHGGRRGGEAETRRGGEAEGWREMDHPNKVRKFARKALRSEAARADPNLANDISMLIGQVCLPRGI